MAEYWKKKGKPREKGPGTSYLLEGLGRSSRKEGSCCGEHGSRPKASKKISRSKTAIGKNAIRNLIKAKKKLPSFCARSGEEKRDISLWRKGKRESGFREGWGRLKGGWLPKKSKFKNSTGEGRLPVRAKTHV